MTRNVFITGCSRGIGLEFVSQFAEKGDQVFALLRDPNSSQFKSLAEKYSNVRPIQCDVTDFSKLKEMGEEFKDTPIDILINNAGTSGVSGQTIGKVDPENMSNLFKINTIAPVMMAQSFITSIEKGQHKTIANITSRMGSIADNDSGASYAYRSSKSALNSVMHSMGIDLKPKGIKVLLLHPGWVKTDMGGDSALIDTQTSVSAMRDLIEKSHELNEDFYHYSGDVLPW